jgi:hypothetical protein
LSSAKHQWALTLGSDHRTLALKREQTAMTEERRPGLKPEIIAALARESGATEQQINEIISLIGFDRSSILREARLLKKSK